MGRSEKHGVSEKWGSSSCGAANSKPQTGEVAMSIEIDELIDPIHMAFVKVMDAMFEREIDEDALDQCDELIAGLTPEERKAVHSRLALVICFPPGQS
jgi:hypothetical protein